MHTFHLTQLLSSHKSHNSSHTTHLTQLISHNSTLSRAAFVWHLVELLRVLSLNFTQVLSHNSSHNSHNSSHTTPLISQLTQLISRISAHLTTNTTHFTQLLSSHKSHNLSDTTHLSQLISHNSTHSRAAFVWHLVNMNLINSPHPTGNWSWKSCACLCSTGRKMMRLLCLCVHRNMNVIIPPHPTPPPPPTPPHPNQTRWLVPSINVRGWPLFVRGWRGFSVRGWLVCNVRRWLAFNVRRWRVDPSWCSKSRCPHRHRLGLRRGGAKGAHRNSFWETNASRRSEATTCGTIGIHTTHCKPNKGACCHGPHSVLLHRDLDGHEAIEASAHGTGTNHGRHGLNWGRLAICPPHRQKKILTSNIGEKQNAQLIAKVQTIVDIPHSQTMFEGS